MDLVGLAGGVLEEVGVEVVGNKTMDNEQWTIDNENAFSFPVHRLLSLLMLSLSDLKKTTEKTFVRSSGPGGQNVNKSSTRVSLVFDIFASDLRPEEKQRLLRKYQSGFIHVTNQETRSQSQNLELGFQQLHQRIQQALYVQKPRKKSIAPHRTKSGKKVKAQKDRLLKYRKRYLE